MTKADGVVVGLGIWNRTKNVARVSILFYTYKLVQDINWKIELKIWTPSKNLFNVN